jgi:hypothetical protein
VGLAGLGEARRPAPLDAAAQDAVVVEAEALQVERLGAAVTEVDVAPRGIEGDREEGGVLDVDLAAEAAQRSDEDALLLQEADAAEQRAVNARVGDALALVDEGAVATEQQARGQQRRWSPQPARSLGCPFVSSIRTPRQS